MPLEIAPISQIFLTIQFAVPYGNLNPIRQAEVFSVFRDRFPIFEQVTRAGPMPTEIVDAIQVFPQFGDARTVFYNEDRSLAVFFQDDRFSFSWDRISPLDQPPEYPGYDAILEQALAAWRQLDTLILHSGDSEPLVGEIVYMDHFAGDPAEGFAGLGRIYAPLAPDYESAASRYVFTWAQPFNEAGSLQTQIQGPVFFGGHVATQLQQTARFRLAGGWEGLKAGFDKAHSSVEKSFKSLIRPDFRPI